MEELTYLRNQLGDVIPDVEESTSKQVIPQTDPDFNEDN